VREPLPTRVQALPPLPADYDRVLDAGLAELGLELDPAARTAIADHVRLMLAWTTAINLTAIREPAAVARAHVLDSLTAIAPLRDRGVTRLLDLGSGAGFPGLPLAVALPAEQVLLVEPIAKKARFLDAAVEAVDAGARVEVGAVRAESLALDPDHRGRWPAITARAVASLAELVELSLPLLAPGGILVAWKRGDLVDEVAAAQRAIEALGGGSMTSVVPGVTGLDEHRLIVITARGRVPTGYPRDPASRKRRPW
jgi:16S rRNA (guanine527-N7)-methyltransferase